MLAFRSVLLSTVVTVGIVEARSNLTLRAPEYAADGSLKAGPQDVPAHAPPTTVHEGSDVHPSKGDPTTPAPTSATTPAPFVGPKPPAKDPPTAIKTVKNLPTDQQLAGAVQFLDPTGAVNLRLGDCVNLRDLFVANPASLPFFRQDVIDKNTTQHADPITNTNIVNKHDVDALRDMWGVGASVPFAPIPTAGVFLSGGFSATSATQETTDNIGFKVGTYATHWTRSIDLKHGFTEDDLAVALPNIQCSHVLQSVSMGSTLEADVDITTTEKLWSQQQSLKLAANIGLFPSSIAAAGPTWTGMAGAAAHHYGHAAVGALAAGMPFLNGLSSVLTGISVGAHFEHNKTKAFEGVNLTISTKTRGLDGGDGIDTIPDASLQSVEQRLQKLQADLRERQSNTEKTNKQQIAGLSGQVDSLERLLGQVVPSGFGPFHDSEDHQEHSEDPPVGPLLPAPAHSPTTPSEPAEEEDPLKGMDPLKASMAKTIAEYLSLKKKVIPAAEKSNTPLKYVLVPISSLANMEHLPPATMMTATDEAISRALGQTQRHIDTFTKSLKDNQQNVQDALITDYIQCIVEVETQGMDVILNTWNQQSPSKEEANKILRSLKLAQNKFTVPGLRTFFGENCAKISASMSGDQATMGRFVNRSDLLKFIKGWRASVTASLEEARSYVDHAAPWGTAWNGDRNVRWAHAAQQVLDKIQNLYQANAKVFSDAYADTLVKIRDSFKPADEHGRFGEQMENKELAKAYEKIDEYIALIKRLRGQSLEAELF